MPKRPPSSNTSSRSYRNADHRADAIGRLLIVLLRAYQLLLRPALASACRFTPSCSAFALGDRAPRSRPRHPPRSTPAAALSSVESRRLRPGPRAAVPGRGLNVDQRRLLLAFALSLVVLVLYQELVLRKYRPAQRRA